MAEINKIISIRQGWQSFLKFYQHDLFIYIFILIFVIFRVFLPALGYIYLYNYEGIAASKQFEI